MGRTYPHDHAILSGSHPNLPGGPQTPKYPIRLSDLLSKKKKKNSNVSESGLRPDSQLPGVFIGDVTYLTAVVGKSSRPARYAGGTKFSELGFTLSTAPGNDRHGTGPATCPDRSRRGSEQGFCLSTTVRGTNKRLPSLESDPLCFCTKWVRNVGGPDTAVARSLLITSFPSINSLRQIASLICSGVRSVLDRFCCTPNFAEETGHIPLAVIVESPTRIFEDILINWEVCKAERP